MPTSPLPSSSNSAGFKWPDGTTDHGSCNINVQDGTASMHCSACGGETEQKHAQNKHVQFENSDDAKATCSVEIQNEKVTNDVYKRQNSENLEKSGLLDTRKNCACSDSCATKSLYKTYPEEQPTCKTFGHMHASVTDRRCENTHRNCDSTNISVIPNVDTPHTNQNERSQAEIRKILKKNRRRKLSRCGFVACVAFVILLSVAVASLVTYIVVKDKQHNEETTTKPGHLPKTEGPQVTKKPHTTAEFNNGVVPYIHPGSEGAAQKLPGVFVNLKTSSLKESGKLLKWQRPSSGGSDHMTNAIIYSVGRFIATKSKWYILYSKLYLVTHREYENGALAMDLHNYAHCIEFEAPEGQTPRDPICNKGSVWGGYKGQNTIWQVVSLSEGTSVKVTMSNKKMVFSDASLNSFEMIELGIHE